MEVLQNRNMHVLNNYHEKKRYTVVQKGTYQNTYFIQDINTYAVNNYHDKYIRP